MNPNFRNFALWVIIVLLVVALVVLFQKPGERAPTQEINYSQLLSDADAGHIKDVTIAGSEITGHYTDGKAFSIYAPNDPNLVSTLNKKGVQITARPPSDGNNWLVTLLVNGLPLIAFIGMWIFFPVRCRARAARPWGLASPRRNC